MSGWLWAVVIGALIACPIPGGICAAKARESGATDELAESFATLEREIGQAFEPMLRRISDGLVRWREAYDRRYDDA